MPGTASSNSSGFSERNSLSISAFGKLLGIPSWERNSSYCFSASSIDFGCTPGPLDHMMQRRTSDLPPRPEMSNASWWKALWEP